MVPRPWKPVVILSTQNKISSIFTDTQKIYLNSVPTTETAAKKLHLYLVVSQTEITVYSQAAVIISCNTAGRKTVETHLNAFEHRFLLSVKGLMDILLGKQYYVYIMDLIATLVHLPKDIVVASASTDPKCITGAHDDESCTRGRQVLPQSELANTVIIVHFNPPKSRDDEVDRHNTVKNPTTGRDPNGKRPDGPRRLPGILLQIYKYTQIVQEHMLRPPRSD